MDWSIIIKIGHIIGTVLGVGGATFAEIFSHNIAKKGMAPDESETRLLRLTYSVMRAGLILLIISGFGYLLLLRFSGQTQYIYSPRVWAKLLITLIILINAILLHMRKIPFWLGSAISVTSWYAALIIGSWRVRADFWVIILVYFLAVAGIAIIKKTKTV